MPLLADEARSSNRRENGGASPWDASGSAEESAEIVRRLENADRTVLTEFFRRHGKPCYALARRICADDGLAEQVVLEVFLALWRNPRSLDVTRQRPLTRNSIATRLLTLTHRGAVDAVRRANPGARTSATHESEEAESGPDPGVAQLTSEQRRVLALAYFGGCTQREIASLTDLSLDTVKSAMLAGIQRLRSLLTDQDGRDAIFAEGRAMGEVSR